MVTCQPVVSSPVISYVPSPRRLFKADFNPLSVILPSPSVYASPIAKFTCSSICAILVSALDSFVLAIIPSLPSTILMLIPAKISKTTMVTTSAISVIPLSLNTHVCVYTASRLSVFFLSFFIFFPPLFFSVKLVYH